MCCDWSIKQAGESKPAFIARLSIELLPISPINLTGFFFSPQNVFKTRLQVY